MAAIGTLMDHFRLYSMPQNPFFSSNSFGSEIFLVGNSSPQNKILNWTKLGEALTDNKSNVLNPFPNTPF